MNKEERLKELESLKRRYLILRELIVYCKSEYEKERKVKEKQEVKEQVKVKKLVLTKPFYGKELIVG